MSRSVYGRDIQRLILRIFAQREPEGTRELKVRFVRQRKGQVEVMISADRWNICR